ncbi:MAG: hypothetical protein ACT4PT_10515 [Methanobacteriota archaeon]
MKKALLAVVIILLSAVAAGCIGDDAGVVVEPIVASDVPAAFALSLNGCVEAGDVSTYQIGGGPIERLLDASFQLPDPWILADTREEIGGGPPIDGFGQPVTGPLTGFWHMAIVCDSLDVGGLPFVMSWGGVLVEPPPWDDSDIERQFLLAHLSLGDPEIVAAARAAGLASTGNALAGFIEHLSGDMLHSFVEDDVFGAFEIRSQMRELTPSRIGETTRLWLPQAMDDAGAVHEHDADAHRPFAIDFNPLDIGPDAVFRVQGGAAVVMHTERVRAGPVDVLVPPHQPGFKVSGVVERGPIDGVMTLGPEFEVVLDWTLHH